MVWLRKSQLSIVTIAAGPYCSTAATYSCGVDAMLRLRGRGHSMTRSGDAVKLALVGLSHESAA
jgi:hypothetical protein